MAFDAIVVGTGFGGTIAAVQLAAKGKSVLLLERGTFWRSPEPIGLNSGDAFGDWARTNKMPVQYWPRPDHRKGLLDFAAAIRNLHKFGLYQYSIFDQADVLTASGVGGGSLIYSNVSVRSEQAARGRISLNISDADYDAARLWMEGPHGDRRSANRGWLNYVVTKIPMGRDMTAADFVNLGIDSTQPPLQQDTDEAYLLLDRSRVLRMAAKQVSKKLNIPMKWEPLELSLIEFDGYRNTATVDGGASPNFFQLMGAAWHANLGEHLFEIPDTVDPKNFQTEAEMLVDTFFFNVMGQDEATGKLKLGGIDGDQIDLDWEQPIAQQQLWADIETILREFSSAMGGRFIDLPTWQGLLGEKKLVIVHPLGGCPIGTTHEDGVVNEFGQAFDAGKSASSKAVLPGLYVVDGAVIPGALAANPSLTISAQALKSVNKAVA